MFSSCTKKEVYGSMGRSPTCPSNYQPLIIDYFMDKTSVGDVGQTYSREMVFFQARYANMVEWALSTNFVT